jgi:hypothetical protein
MGQLMPKMRPPSANLAEWHKVLHGIHRLEERMIAWEAREAAREGHMADGTLRPIPQGAKVYNDDAGDARPWVPKLKARDQR